MPLMSGITNEGGNLKETLKNPINELFSMIDKRVLQIARERGLSPSQVRMLRPCNFCVLINDFDVFVVLTNVNVGGIPVHQYIDWSGKPMDLESALFIVSRDLAFENVFGFSFTRNILTFDKAEKEKSATEISQNYIEGEIMNLERLNRIVRINPIFQGRDYMINDNLTFVLSPFSEPFNTIYTDHIKPAVESFNNMKCLRADNIYDNRPIIEDIWKNINEAKIIIAELTGRNPNVFYEVGIAHTVGKEVILISQIMDDVPFDLRHLRCIVYEYTPRGAQLLQTNLQNTITNILARTSR